MNLSKAYGALSGILFVSDLLSFGAVLGQVGTNDCTLTFLLSWTRGSACLLDSIYLSLPFGEQYALALLLLLSPRVSAEERRNHQYSRVAVTAEK